MRLRVVSSTPRVVSCCRVTLEFVKWEAMHRFGLEWVAFLAASAVCQKVSIGYALRQSRGVSLRIDLIGRSLGRRILFHQMLGLQSFLKFCNCALNALAEDIVSLTSSVDGAGCLRRHLQTIIEVHVNHRLIASFTSR